jgi:hypothetical protein
VQAPRTDWPDLGDLGVERDLSFAPVLPTFAVVAVAEYQIALAAIGVESPGLSAQDLDGQRHQRNDMLALVLGLQPLLSSRPRQYNLRTVEVDLTPAQIGDFVASGEGQDQ